MKQIYLEAKIDEIVGLYFLDFVNEHGMEGSASLEFINKEGYKLIQLYRIKDEKEIWHDVAILEKE